MKEGLCDKTNVPSVSAISKILRGIGAAGNMDSDGNVNKPAKHTIDGILGGSPEGKSKDTTECK